jgi:probable phosphoglycerate mutase
MPASNEALPIVHLDRDGETVSSLSGQHTGATDVPLAARGARARSIAERRRGLRSPLVRTSPLQRAARTCEIASFKSHAELGRNLVVQADGGAAFVTSWNALGPVFISKSAELAERS